MSKPFQSTASEDLPSRPHFCKTPFPCTYMQEINEPPKDKTNKMACAPSEDSDQPGHLPSLIRVFAVIMKKAWAISYQCAQRRLRSAWAST